MSESDNHFNLHTTGKGFLNDFRQVTDPKGKYEPFWSVRINAQIGRKPAPGKKANYTRFNCNLPENGQALALLLQHKDRLDPTKKPVVQASFKLSDLEPDSYVKKIEGKDQLFLVIKGRLFEITWLKINDDVVFHKSANADSQDQATDAVDAVIDDEQPVDDEWEDSPEPQHSEPLVKLTPVVTLDPHDKDYPKKVPYLLSNGYTYDEQSDVYRRMVS